MSELLDAIMQVMGVPKSTRDEMVAKFKAEQLGNNAVVIRHSGGEFKSLGFSTEHNAYIWPISEYLIRRRHKPKVSERIARLNPNGKPEGEMPRGIVHKPRVIPFVYDAVRPKEFIRRHGRQEYRASKSYWRHQGHRKFMDRQTEVKQPWKRHVSAVIEITPT